MLSLKTPEKEHGSPLPDKSWPGWDGGGVGGARPRGPWSETEHLSGPPCVQPRPAAGISPAQACRWSLYPRPQGSLPPCAGNCQALEWSL